MYVMSQWRFFWVVKIVLACLVSSFVAVICTADANEDISIYSGLISINK
jgi:hypothetical protein